MIREQVADTTVLTVPPVKRPRTALQVAVVTVMVVLSYVGLGPVGALIAAVVGITLSVWDHQLAPTWRFEISGERRYVLRGPRKQIADEGDAADLQVFMRYDQDDALGVFRWFGKRRVDIHHLGDADIEAIASFCKDAGLRLVVENTPASVDVTVGFRNRTRSPLLGVAWLLLPLLVVVVVPLRECRREQAKDRIAAPAVQWLERLRDRPDEAHAQLAPALRERLSVADLRKLRDATPALAGYQRFERVGAKNEDGEHWASGRVRARDGKEHGVVLDLAEASGAVVVRRLEVNGKRLF